MSLIPVPPSGKDDDSLASFIEVRRALGRRPSWLTVGLVRQNYSITLCPHSLQPQMLSHHLLDFLYLFAWLFTIITIC